MSGVLYMARWICPDNGTYVRVESKWSKTKNTKNENVSTEINQVKRRKQDGGSREEKVPHVETGEWLVWRGGREMPRKERRGVNGSKTSTRETKSKLTSGDPSSGV